MKTSMEIAEIISNQIARALGEDDFFADYKVVVCNERIFTNDYQPMVDDYEQRRANNTYDEYEKPTEMPFRKTIFFLIKIGQGQTNMAVTTCPMSIQCLSEENDFSVAHIMLRKFIASVNYEYLDGIVQQYFTPENMTNFEQVYNGFRSLLTCKGQVRIPEDGVAFVTNILVADDEGNDFNLPFISEAYNVTGSPEPMAFAGNLGRTSARNRQSTTTLSITTYLWSFANAGAGSLEKQLNDFTSDVLGFANGMNKVFHIAFRSNVRKADGTYLNVVDRKFICTSVTQSQGWGEVVPWSIGFTENIEEE